MKRLLVLILAITLTSCASLNWESGLDYVEPAFEFAASTAINAAISPEDRVDKANMIYASAKALRTLSGGEVTKDSVKDVLDLWLPSKSHWSDFAGTASNLWAPVYAKLKGNPKLIAEYLEKAALGIERAAGKVK